MMCDLVGGFKYDVDGTRYSILLAVDQDPLVVLPDISELHIWR